MNFNILRKAVLRQEGPRIHRLFTTLCLLGMICGARVNACSGGESWVSATATIPTGWIETAKSADGSQVLIRDISCETLNATETMIFGSPLPDGWVVTAQQMDSNGYPIYTITCIKNAPFLDGIYVIANFSIPKDWVVTSTSSGGSYSYNYITCLAGAPFNDTETVLYWSPVPNGWVPSPASNGYVSIKNTNRVTASITTPASSLTVATGTSVSFAGTATDSTANAPLTYSWNFGDGHTVTGNSATHLFTNSGTVNINYTVTFKAQDADNYFGTATRVVTVTPTPPAPVAVSVSPTSIDLQVPTVYPIDPLPGRPMPPPPSASYQFNATVQNSSNQGVTWSISPLFGTISSTGLYRVSGSPLSAPPYTKTVTVRATSQADPTKYATAIITLHSGDSSSN